MKWKKIDQYCIKSNDGYHICRVTVEGRVVYSAFAPRTADVCGKYTVVNHLALCSHSTAAKKACEVHHAQA